MFVLSFFVFINYAFSCALPCVLMVAVAATCHEVASALVVADSCASVDVLVPPVVRRVRRTRAHVGLLIFLYSFEVFVLFSVFYRKIGLIVWMGF